MATADFIPVLRDLPSKREMTFLMRSTGMSKAETLYALFSFLAWVDTESADGTIRLLTVEDLASVVPSDGLSRFPLYTGQDGESQPGPLDSASTSPETRTAFVRALAACDWLRDVPGGGVEFVPFSSWLGRTAKRRLSNLHAQRRCRRRSEEGE